MKLSPFTLHYQRAELGTSDNLFTTSLHPLFFALFFSFAAYAACMTRQTLSKSAFGVFTAHLFYFLSAFMASFSLSFYSVYNPVLLNWSLSLLLPEAIVADLFVCTLFCRIFNNSQSGHFCSPTPLS